MLHVLAQDGAAQQPAPSFLDALVSMAPMMLVLWLIWWLLVLRPQGKQKRQREQRLTSLKRGDKVRTRGGIVGSIVKLKGDVVVLRDLGDGKGHVTILKGAIEDLFSDDDNAET